MVRGKPRGGMISRRGVAPAAKPCRPAAVASSAPRLPRPLLRMKAPAETRAGISERVMGSAMRGQCPPPRSSTVGQRPRRDRALKLAADDVPARAASSARVRAGPAGRPESAAFAEPPVVAEPLVELLADPPEPPRRRPPPPCGCGAGAGAGSTYGAAGPVSSVIAVAPGR